MNIKKVLKMAMYTPGLKGAWGINLLIVSHPGESKTSQMESEANAHGLYAETFIGSIHEPTDISGVPMLTKLENGEPSVKMAVSEIANTLIQQPRSLLFLDELNTSQPSMQAAMLGVTLERKMGGTRLPKSVRCLAAMNPTTSSTGGSRLSKALINRMVLLNWDGVDTDEWCSWLSEYDFGDSTNVDVDTSKGTSLERVVLSKWKDEFPKAKGAVAGYIARNKQAFREDAAKVKGDTPYATPRSWTTAIHVLAGCRIHEVEEGDTETLVAGAIGSSTSSEFFNYLGKLDLPDCAAIMSGRLPWKPSKHRLDVTCVVLETCASIVLGEKDQSKRENLAENLWKLISDVDGVGALDAANSVVKSMIKNNLMLITRPINSQVVTKTITRLGGMV